MPLPTPNKGEKKKKFLSRCMENPTMVSEYSDEKQRYAVCNSKWSKKEKSMGEEIMGLNELDKRFERAYKAMGKKLTTKTRKKLKKSTFCGPGRSFPIPDCKHVAVAKAYLGRSKFSKSTKKKIAACINRKAKQLGCKVSKKAKAHYDEAGKFEYNRFIELSAEEKKLYTSDIFKTTKEIVDASMRSPNNDLLTTDIFDE